MEVEDDLVSGVGWISDESDFYGDDDTKTFWEDQTTTSNNTALLRALSTSPQKIALAARKPTAAAVPAQLHFPRDGQLSYRQSTETVAGFVDRLRPSTCKEMETGPWIWVTNPHILPGSRPRMNEEMLLETGMRLLETHRQLREKTEQQMQGKAQSSITRKLNPAKDRLQQDLYDAAVEAKCLSGKWMLFVDRKNIDHVWRIVAEAVSANKLGPIAKVATGSRRDDDNQRLICVYTDDFSNKADVRRVLDTLVELDLVSSDNARGIYYKYDAYTYWGIERDNVYKLKASLYGSNEMLGTFKPKKGSSGFDF